MAVALVAVLALLAGGAVRWALDVVAVPGENAPAFVHLAANPPCGRTAEPPQRYDHVVWIVMENKHLHGVHESQQAPYLDELADVCGASMAMTAETHPSLPNYLAMTSGSTHGITGNVTPAEAPLDAPSIFTQLDGDWRAYAEDLPGPCVRENAGDYAVRHVPALYYTDLQPLCETHVLPLTAAVDLSARFTFITPDLCGGLHRCANGGMTTTGQLRNGDAWLQRWMPRLLNSPEYRAGRTAIILTWDEGTRTDQRIPTVVIAPSVRPGTESRTPLTHYSLLKGTEEMLGLPVTLGRAADPGTTSLKTAFGL
jgi:hypothetical protein